MSSGFYDKSEKEGRQRNKDAEIYVSGIPVDLDKEGLANIFCKAGQIEAIRIIPPKNLAHSTTFGFINFLNRTSAATAIETFNYYKIGQKPLTVRFSENSSQTRESSSSQASAFMTPASSSQHVNDYDSNNRSTTSSRKESTNITTTTIKTETVTNNLTSDQMTEIRSMGRGVLYNNKNAIKKPVFNTTRPYARQLYRGRSITSTPSDSDLDIPRPKTSSTNSTVKPVEIKQVSPEVKQEALSVGQSYKVMITHVNTPGNFYVQLTSTLPAKANLINNLDNHYRNNLSDDNEFSSCDSSAIRCKIFNLKPVGDAWDNHLIETFVSLQKQNDVLEAQIFSCEDYKINDQTEKIYAVDLLFCGEDSLIEYMLDTKLSVEEKPIKSSKIQPPVQQQSKLPSIEPEPKPQPLKEKNVNIQPEAAVQPLEAEKSPVKNVPIQCKAVKLIKNQVYTVNIQYFDETYSDQYFYLTLRDNAAKLDELDTKLQQDTKSSTKFEIINDLSTLKVNDVLEALFSFDQKWYRVKITQITADRIDIYFLDYGNSQLLKKKDIINEKLFRKRQTFDNKEERDIFSLDYQAIKCIYLKDKQLALETFVEKLSNMSSIESGFDILINNIEADVYAVNFFDIATPSSVDVDDDVFNTSIINQQMCSLLTMSESEIGLNLDIDTKLNSLISHIVSSSEFYVQLPSNLEQLISHQQRLQTLAELCQSLEFQSIKGQATHQSGDLCLARYLTDWYRGVVLNVNQVGDDYLYDIYFCDYGNTEQNMPSNLICSINAIKNATRKKNLDNELKQAIELPFQAICCQIYNRKSCTRNTEILKTLLSDCSNFNICIKQLSKHCFNEQISIKKYSVNLYSDNRLLDDQFEPIVQVAAPAKEIKLIDLENKSVHEFKLAHFGSETELFVNLPSQSEALEQLQSEINADVQTINKSTNDSKFKVNDLVLAKFYNEDRSFDWYRAKITAIDSNIYQVFYIDYGNIDSTLAVDDLRQLPLKYTKQPQFAYNIRLNGITNINHESNEALLGEYLLGEHYKMKVISKKDDYYLVELWNQDLTKCLNKLIDTNYTVATDLKPIETSKLNELFEPSLKVNTKYIYIEDFQRPFYFCLKQDISERDTLSNDLNAFYSKSSISSFKPELNDYCAVLSDNAWYRAQVKSIDTNKYHLFFIDYGFDEIMEPCDRIKPLVEQFLDKPRFIFGAYLVEPNTSVLIKFDQIDENDLALILSQFFTEEHDELELILNNKINESVHFEKEFYFGVEIINKNKQNLNQLIAKAKKDTEIKKEVVKKPKLPDYIRLRLSDIPQQSKTEQAKQSDKYMLFSKHIDLFYIFEETKVMKMQQLLQEACKEILKQVDLYESDINQLPAKGDLVYAKYEDDQSWYRCLITNCNQSKNKYELFFIDFGNTEVNAKEDILYGWTKEQVELLQTNPPIAYKSKLYGLKPPKQAAQFSEEQNAAFKDMTSDKLFNVKFVKFNSDAHVYEICMNEANSASLIQLHSDLIKKNLAELSCNDLFETLQSVKLQDEIEFYSDLVNSFKRSERQFS